MPLVPFTNTTPLSRPAPVAPVPTQTAPPASKKRTKVSPFAYIAAIVGGILVFVIIFLVIFVVIPGQQLLAQANALKAKETRIKQAISSRDLNQMKNVLADLRVSQKQIQASYQKLSTAGSLPVVKGYYQDGQQGLKIFSLSLDTADIVIKAIEPYQDFIGLTGTATGSGTTTEDRITFLTDSIESLVPQMNTIQQKVDAIQTALNQIDASRYPDEFRGFKIKSTLLQGKETIAQVDQLLKDGQPFLSKTSWLLGKDAPRQYLLLFQNNAELRPSGGFWTAYGILKVANGKVTPVISDDIYALDNKLDSTITPPRPIKAYHINASYWYLRDMNISPDFPTDAQTFVKYYSQVNPNDQFDAVIALDTQVLVDFVKVLGRIGVPGYGNFTPDADPRCDGCPQIIYQLEYYAGKPRNYIETNRKGFLAPLMHSLLQNAMQSPKEKIGPLVQNMLNDLFNKHILMYFKDTDIQQAAVKANIAGAITTTAANTDYFHLNDANMDSAKSNLFITQKIKHEITTQNNQVQHKVTITYTNPSKASNCNLEKGDLCLNASKYRDWFRFYVPTGSQLIKMTGSEVTPVQYEELGKQVFEGFYGDKYPLYAQSSNIVSVQYASSVKPSSDYTLLLQKQPGTKDIDYQIWVNGKLNQSFTWSTDKTIKLAL